MRRVPRSFVWLVLSAAFVLTAQPSMSEEASAKPAEKAAEKPAEKPLGPGFDVGYMDRSVDPCVDFYQYACGTWLARNPVPADQPLYNRGFQLYLRNAEIVKSILEAAAVVDPNRDPLDQKVGDDYASCMDEAGIEAAGTKPLLPTLTLIEKMASKSELPAVIAALHIQGVGAFFSFGAQADFKDASKTIAWVDEGGLGLPDRDYYLKDDERSVGLRKAYRAHVEAMMGLLGDAPEAAAAGSQTVLDIETALAKVTMDRVARREPANLYHPTTRKELAALTPEFGWDAYFTALGSPGFESLSVTSLDFLKGLDALLKTQDLAAQKTYLRWQAVHNAARLMPKAFVDEHFDFYGKKLRGAQANRPRWQRCMQVVEGHLGFALGRRFAEKTFGPEGKERTLKMVAALRAAVQKDIEDVPWMTAKTKAEAQAKLAAVATRIAYPDRWHTYASLRIDRGDALGNDLRANEFEAHRDMAKIGMPVDKSEWPFPPTTMNAGYEPQVNTMTFSAAMLQPPFYENSMDDAVNMGAIGAVIGHELTHGFDDKGRKFDASGNLRDWWTADDAREFDTRASCIENQYAGYTAVGDVKLNGKLTLGENVADNGGLRVAYAALQSLLKETPQAKRDGFTAEQRFFLGFAQITCENRTDQVAEMRARTDPHAPGRYRANGVVSNMPEFQKAFQCKAGAPMVRESVCKVW